MAAIHPSFDDSAQNPRAWHTHTVTLDSNSCITDLGKSQGGISIKGDTLTLQISTKFVEKINLNGAASFEVHPDNNCPDPHLRVDVLDQEPIS